LRDDWACEGGGNLGHRVEERGEMRGRGVKGGRRCGEGVRWVWKERRGWMGAGTRGVDGRAGSGWEGGVAAEAGRCC
jgi:hypothetical protein